MEDFTSLETGEKHGSPFSAVEILGIRQPSPRDPFREIGHEVGRRDGLPRAQRRPPSPQAKTHPKGVIVEKETPERHRSRPMYVTPS